MADKILNKDLSLASVSAAYVPANTTDGWIVNAKYVAVDKGSELIPLSEYISSVIENQEAMSFKGILNSTKQLPTSAKAGAVYKVAEAGKYGIGSNADGIEVTNAHVGDLLICTGDYSSKTVADTPTYWELFHTSHEGTATISKALTSGLVLVSDGNTGLTNITNAIGSSTSGIYITSEGKIAPVAYTVASNVPGDAKFSDTAHIVAKYNNDRIEISTYGIDENAKDTITLSGNDGISFSASSSDIVISVVTAETIAGSGNGTNLPVSSKAVNDALINRDVRISNIEKVVGKSANGASVATGLIKNVNDLDTRIDAVESQLGLSDGQGVSITSRVAALEEAVGEKAEGNSSTATGLYKDIADINSIIGASDTAGTILNDIENNKKSISTLSTSYNTLSDNVVNSIDVSGSTLKGAVTLKAGSNVTVSASNNTIKIEASADTTNFVKTISIDGNNINGGSLNTISINTSDGIKASVDDGTIKILSKLADVVKTKANGETVTGSKQIDIVAQRIEASKVVNDSRFYSVATDENGNLAVYVPWSNTTDLSGVDAAKVGGSKVVVDAGITGAERTIDSEVITSVAQKNGVVVATKMNLIPLSHSELNTILI